ncbi:hypothetical protein HCA55_17280 [Listeria booriae]|uniref:Fungal lipase-like domain-containing protein n=1 Tax=Listeria booriae TaxID=1552123 RepID=A0A842B3M9_9LIST|nr:hypothetical protein [Listeria booriae]MBC1798494.1 hypothetical protein [Listeria booriae]
MTKTQGITAASYFDLTDQVYSNDILKIGRIIYHMDGKTNFVVIDAVNQPKSGLQAIATVSLKEYEDMKAGKIDTYSHIVFASRGSELNLAEFKKDWINTDMNDLAFGLNPGLESTQNKVFDQLNNTKIPGFLGMKIKDVSLPGIPKIPESHGNQFAEYKVFVDQTVTKFNPQDYSFTGHSLGGTLAQVMAVTFQKEAVTYAAANPYRILSPEQKQLVRQGYFKDMITDYRHMGDPVGVGIPGMIIGRQFIMATNGAELPLLGHKINTFAGMFDSNGAAKLHVDPAEIKKQAYILEMAAEKIVQLHVSLLDYKQAEMEGTKRIQRRLENETQGGDYAHLDYHDVDNALYDISQGSERGTYLFHDSAAIEKAGEELNKFRMLLGEFSYELKRAADDFQTKDIELGNFINTQWGE